MIILKISRSLWKYYRGEPSLYVNDATTSFHVDNNNSDSFIFNDTKKY